MTEQALEQAREELRATLMDAIQKIDESMQRPPRLLGENEAGKYLGVSGRTLRDWRDKGIGPEYLKLEGNEKLTRYDIKELDKYIDEHPRRKERRA